MAEPLLPLPDRWSRTTLEARPADGFIVKVESGGTPSTGEDEYWDGAVPWLTPKEVTGNRESLFVTRTERNITEAGLSASAAKLLPAETVMLTKRAPVGAVAINSVPMATNQGFLNFTCGPKLRPLYLAYWLVANERYLNQVANGSTYRELYQSDLFEFEMAVPLLAEQDAILKVVNAVQYLALLGFPLAQSVSNAEDMLRVQNQTRRLIAFRDALLVQLLSGRMAAGDLNPSTEDAKNGRHDSRPVRR